MPKALANRLKDVLSCHEPDCFLSLLITAASVRVRAQMVIPEVALSQAGDDSAPASATAAAVGQSVQAAAAQLAGQDASILSATLSSTAFNVVVIAAAPVHEIAWP